MRREEQVGYIFESIKNRVEAVVGPMELSIPTVVHGRNFITRSRRGHEGTVVRLECLGEELLIQVMLLPNEGRGLKRRLPAERLNRQ